MSKFDEILAASQQLTTKLGGDGDYLSFPPPLRTRGVLISLSNPSYFID